MKKVTFLVTNKEYDSFTHDLRSLGVVHVDQLQAGATSEEFEAARELAERYKNAFKALDFAAETYTHSEQAAKSLASDTTLSLVEQIEAILQREGDVKRAIEQTEKDIHALEPWGEFSNEQLRQLSSHGYVVSFFACPSKMFRAEWKDEYFATPIDEIDKKIYFITFSPEHPDITAEHVELPQQPLSYYQSQLADLQAELTTLHDTLLDINEQCRAKLTAADVEVSNDIALSRVHLSGESVADGALQLMQGWVPAEREDELKTLLDSKHIFYEVESPAFDDNVPIEIKNDKYSSLFEPILKMYSLPNYHDLDVTPFFAPFFMLFFGLCMGDAGYGILILLVSILLNSKLPQEQKPYARLGIWLGAMTTVCGALTGSFFGIDLSQQDWAFLTPVKHYFINENNYHPFNYSPMMVASIVIGLVQVLLGMVLAAIKAGRNYGWKFGVGKMSWVVALLAAIVLFGLPLCEVALTPLVTYVLYGILAVAVLGIFFFNSPDKNIFMNFATGIWDTYSMATGLLGDLLSYIRLFALGLTGGVLGGVFNTLAIDLTSSMSWAIRWLPMLIILLLGHGINFALCMISSFVHPMRLTFVEFFKNANFEGGGKAYEPFKMKS